MVRIRFCGNSANRLEKTLIFLLPPAEATLCYDNWSGMETTKWSTWSRRGRSQTLLIH